VQNCTSMIAIKFIRIFVTMKSLTRQEFLHALMEEMLI